MATARTWSAEQVRALGVTTDVVTAGSVLGFGRTTAYRLAREVGGRYLVAVAHLLQAVAIDT